MYNLPPYVVPADIINAIITLASDWKVLSRVCLMPQFRGSLPPGSYSPFSLESSPIPQAIADILLAENIKSVNHYFKGMPPDPGNVPIRFMPDYHASTEFYEADLACLMNCYRHQSCHHPDWEASLAYQFCQCLQAELVDRLSARAKINWAYEPPPAHLSIPPKFRSIQNDH